jgi:23S rRNA pseudouridine1911/1915/1917 synthase
MEQNEQQPIKFKLADAIIFEDEEVVVLNKPAGMLTLPDRQKDALPNLRTVLDKAYGKIFVVHRLDKDTSGIIVFAKNENIHRELSMQFEERAVKKFYVGLVNGQLMEKQGTVNVPIAPHPNGKGMMVWHRTGKASVTDYEVLEDFTLYSWLRFQIHTGRTHQIRVHTKYLGHPLVCDDMYGDGKPFLLSSIKRNFKQGKFDLTERPMLNRVALHAEQIQLKINEKNFSWAAELPKDLRAVLQQLRKK